MLTLDSIVKYPIHYDLPIAETPIWKIGFPTDTKTLAENILSIYLELPNDNWNRLNKILYPKEFK